MIKKRIFFVLFATIFIFIVFRSWFMGSEIIGGDWSYRFPEMIRDMSRAPSSWQDGYGGGLGGLSPSYFLSTYNFVSARFSVVTGLPWVTVYKLFWFYSPVIIVAIGGWRLLGTLFSASPLWMRALASLIISTNTYVLMITGGGQMGVFYAVSMFPWVLLSFFRFLTASGQSFVKTKRAQRWIGTMFLGVVFGIQVSLDPRIAYLSIICMGVLYCFEENGFKFLLKRMGFGVIAASISVLLNSYWLLPLVLLRENTLATLGNAYTTVGALQFFSFADFSHALSLLHPNWPENLFGKTYFLKPMFLLLPILAYASLLFTNTIRNNNRDKRLVYGFAALGLVGVFLSKGANEPFGLVYVWLFEHVSGFVMFRDPTKFYVLIMMSYAVLIPFALFSISEVMKKIQKSFLWIVPSLFVLYWIVLIKPAMVGSLGGTFAQREVPMHYVALKKFLSQEQGFFRTLWVTRQSRFTFSSSNEIPIEAGPQLGATDAATLKDRMNAVDIKEHLAMLGVRYIVVPYDPYGEIFVDDRKYSQTKRDDIESVLDAVPWLTKIQSSDIAVYQTPRSKDHFWIENGTVLNWRKIVDDYYVLDVVTTDSSKLIFSENYHQGWQATFNGNKIAPVKERFGIMSFALPEAVEGRVTIEFIPRRYYLWGRWISFSTVLGVLLCLFIFRIHDK